MLTKRTLEMIVDDCMKMYARENNGERGWTKEDIENAVLRHGGEKNDVYAAMKIGMEVCLGECEPIRTLLN